MSTKVLSQELQCAVCEALLGTTNGDKADCDTGDIMIYLGYIHGQLTRKHETAFSRLFHADFRNDAAFAERVLWTLAEVASLLQSNVSTLINDVALARNWRCAAEEGHPFNALTDFLELLSNAAWHFRETGDFTSAMELVDIGLEAAGSDHKIITAHLLNTSGVVKELTYQYSSSRKVLEECLNIRIVALGSAHLETTGVKMNLASIVAAQGHALSSCFGNLNLAENKLEDARANYQSCLDAYTEDILEKNTHMTCGCYYKPSLTEMQLGDQDRALADSGHLDDAMKVAQKANSQGYIGRILMLKLEFAREDKSHRPHLGGPGEIQLKIKAVQSSLEAQSSGLEMPHSPDRFFEYFIPWQARYICWAIAVPGTWGSFL
ncbi:uncharacterized protein NECHADRAFT_76113 [Fusarium vanettenii 77-13-4]|uniref:MalT-like TPR region domain-containing protein n=1 Tax=Fusarium vanettenii (strain ATCC MYA-4622 / CBS 123669 / FGSC 9596 / NRRL 45880 / 77-13-4) TaxID=660122 RepID=C7Z6I3_FUSV7|nr:uncharacterized protein NECHADRAFT_76113 [Fusarium vanettenii 77-13-4]EEU40136.1 predicted protein [Fusarium vanettenii 77-13-4]